MQRKRGSFPLPGSPGPTSPRSPRPVETRNVSVIVSAPVSQILEPRWAHGGMEEAEADKGGVVYGVDKTPNSLCAPYFFICVSDKQRSNIPMARSQL